MNVFLCMYLATSERNNIVLGLGIALYILGVLEITMALLIFLVKLRNDCGKFIILSSILSLSFISTKQVNSVSGVLNF